MLTLFIILKVLPKIFAFEIEIISFMFDYIAVVGIIGLIVFIIKLI